MGTLLAIDKDGVVYMGTDLERVESGVRLRSEAESNVRIHRLPSGILCGAIGKIRLAQQMYLHDEWFRLEEGERFDRRFLIEKIVPRFYEALCGIGGVEHDSKHRCDSVDAGFIFAKDGEIFVVFGDLSVVKCKGLAALSGDSADTLMYAYARGSCEGDPEALIRKSFAYVAGKRGTVSECGCIINTRDLTFEKTEDVQ